ncbi:MAG: hypothetical protein ACOCX2_09695, partial [Armatimonadota bacterium]
GLMVYGSLGVAQPQYEQIGMPCVIKSLQLHFVAPDGDGGYMAWGDFKSPDERAIIGVNVETGETTRVDVGKFGFSHIAMTLGADGRIYMYTGKPSHFLAYDMQTGELEDLGIPASPANYFSTGQMASDGKTYYIGSYPATHLVSVDTETGEITHHAKIAEDPKEMYIWPRLAVADDGIVYCPVGLHHKELWSYDPATDEKRQILPAELTAQQGAPSVWLAEDGNVYGKAGDTRFLCSPDGIEVMENVPPAVDKYAPGREAGGLIVHGIDEQGRLKMEDAETGEAVHVQTDYEGQPQMVYSVADERDGKIWGGALFPANSFYYEEESGDLVDVGRITKGSCQVYDVLSVPQGLLMSSYTAAAMDLYYPDRPRGDDNPHRFPRVPMQERPVQFEPGPDGNYYCGTVPVKGILGGALVRLNLEDLSQDYWRNIVQDQSIMYLAGVPETNELLCASSVQGGSSAIPTETEAYVVHWDCDAEEVVHSVRPIPGTRGYGRMVRADTGVVYGLAGAKYYAYDPVEREVLMTGDLPGGRVHFPGLHDNPVNGVIYGLADDMVFAIDPADHSVSVVAEHESLARAHGFMVTDDGVLYYGSGPWLWRCDLSG